MVNAKRKGKEGELEFANLLKDYGYEARRSQQYCGKAGDSDVVGLTGCHVEVKRVQALNITKAMQQAIDDSKDTFLFPIVAHRKNRMPWLVTMRFDDWVKLYNSYFEEGKEVIL